MDIRITFMGLSTTISLGTAVIYLVIELFMIYCAVELIKCW